MFRNTLTYFEIFYVSPFFNTMKSNVQLFVVEAVVRRCSWK